MEHIESVDSCKDLDDVFTDTPQRSVSYGRQNSNMKVVRRTSVNDHFSVSDEEPIPDVPKGGARVKICYAGACYTDSQVYKSGLHHFKAPGVYDTSLFPGYEVSGVVDELCDTIVDTCHLKVGDHVVVYPAKQNICSDGYHEYVIICDIHNLIPLPKGLPLDIAALLPCGALQTYAAVQKALPFVKKQVQFHQNPVNVLIVGAGGLGLWTLTMAKHYIAEAPDAQNRIRLIVADCDTARLKLAKQNGCYDVVHWDPSVFEESIVERTLNVCPNGVDAVIDFVSSPRYINRELRVLNKGGVLIAGGIAGYEVKIDLHMLAHKNQSILGVDRGTRDQLKEVVEIFAQGKIIPPVYKIFSVNQVNEMFDSLRQSKLPGRAILQISDAEFVMEDAAFKTSFGNFEVSDVTIITKSAPPVS